jgi:uncharacterized membrane protein YoaK (UPF0700 family)
LLVLGGLMNGPTTRATLLSLLAGYVDTLGFIALFGLFTAHVTGNLVLLGSELVQPSSDALLKLLVFPAFVASVALTRLLVLRWQATGKPGKPVARAFTLQLALLLASSLAAWLAEPITRADAPLTMLAGLLCAAGMGVQNAYHKLLLPSLPASTVMTGNVTQLVIDLVDGARGHARPDGAGKLLWGVAAFAAGAFLAALAARWGLALGLLPPCVLLAALALTARG